MSLAAPPAIDPAARSFEDEVAATERWMKSPRFGGILRLHTARQVVEQRGTIARDYTVAREAAAAFHVRLRELFEERKSITTFGPYSPGQAVAMKRMGIEGIYLGGWATSAKGSTSEDPGPDLASYPLSQVPDEAATLVRALLTADRNQQFQRLHMTEAQRASTPVVDFRPFIIADADTGHGGDPHVRNLVRRFVEAGVPGYHIEDQRPGTKKCGHQGGKVLVAQDEQNKRLNSARFQLDVMGVPGIIVARTDAEAANLLDGAGDERDQAFLLGATNLDVPAYKACWLELLRAFHEAGVAELNGHLLYAVPEGERSRAAAWLTATGLAKEAADAAASLLTGKETSVDTAFDRVAVRVAARWESDAGLETYGEAVADALEFRASEGEVLPMSASDWRAFAERASLYAAREKARELGADVAWDCERAKTAEGYYQVRGGVPYAIAKSLAAAPFADLLWMETKTADLKDAKEFADAIHAVFPDKMLAYNLSPSFNWDTTGMSDDEMRRFPEELGKMGFVFNFITYGGHQVDGLAAEELATALKQDGMLALARLQRKLRMVESPYRTPQTLVGGPRADAALSATSGRTATTLAMGKGSTQHQHLVQTEVPKKLLEEWLQIWTKHYAIADSLRVQLTPHRAGSELLELAILGKDGGKQANVIFAPIHDRRQRSILSVRDQNTFKEELRKKRLMSLVHLFLVHRFKADSVHYVTPTDDNQYQAEKMKSHGLFSEVGTDVGQIIVADVNHARIAELLAADRAALGRLIRKEEPVPAPGDAI
jgi:isocitrate lyase